MDNLEAFVAACCRFGWLVLLVFTASVLLVAALRKPCRKGFGAERAFLLWLLPPVAMLACLLPHAVAGTSSLPPLVVAIAALPGTTQPGVAAGGIGDWRVWITAGWLVGAVARLSLATFAQRRYRRRLRGAAPYGGDSWRRPILRAPDPRTGPALVGAWRPRIVVPADFDDRYDSAERTLILAHETMHARRLDGCWCLVAQLVTALFWFHPLAWWALGAMRRDQELACDAAVLDENHGRRRSYANALLKAQSATSALPVGCAWSFCHPLTERIAMLKQPRPSQARRASGFALIAAAVLLGAGGAYAATTPPATGGTHAYRYTVKADRYTLPDRYTLKVDLAIDGNAPRLHATLCLKPGKPDAVTERNIGKLPPWHGQFSVAPTAQGMLEVRTKMDGGPLDRPVQPRVITRPGQTATIVLGDNPTDKPGAASGKHTIRIDLTPSVGC